MRVVVGSSIYEMSEKKAEQTIAVAKKCLKRGIYAVSKDSYCELKKENYRSNEDLRKAVENYQKQGFTVYWNGDINL